MTEFIALSLLFLQGIFMAIDEVYFHRRRGLGPWESWGHPLDTLSFLIASLVAIAPSDLFFGWKLELFLGLSIISSILITKDEFIHRQECSGGESWLHAILFVLHPPALWALWQIGNSENCNLLLPEIFLIAVVLVYQIFYWNFRWPKLKV